MIFMSGTKFELKTTQSIEKILGLNSRAHNRILAAQKSRENDKFLKVIRKFLRNFTKVYNESFLETLYEIFEKLYTKFYTKVLRNFYN